MQFTDEVVWTLSDFIFAGILLLGTGLTYKLITRKSGKIAYRTGVCVVLAAGFLLIWINGAVGIIGNEDNPANLMYVLILMVGIIGAFIVRFQSQGMARVLFITALAQMLVPIIALIIWPPKIVSWGATGVFGVFVLNTFFVILFVVSALFFRRAAHKANESEPEIEPTA